ncbi:hypothetical protein BG000_002380 [Podila horticola]|nr:hypothetical protein BG000_002380 [Podila horticola]
MDIKILCGEAVDAWPQLLVEVTTLATSFDAQKDPSVLQLAQFEVINTATDSQPLSDNAVEAILYIVQSCPLAEFKMVKVDLLVNQHWGMIMDELDMVRLINLNLANSNVEHGQELVKSFRNGHD